MNWFWHALWICLFVIPVTLLWVGSIFHIVILRKDLAWWRRLVWLAVVLLLPVIGALIYAGIAAGSDAGDGTGHAKHVRRAERALANAEAERQLQRDYRLDVHGGP